MLEHIDSYWQFLEQTADSQTFCPWPAHYQHLNLGTYLEYAANQRIWRGPYSNADSTVSGKVIDGTRRLLHNSYSDDTLNQAVTYIHVSTVCWRVTIRNIIIDGENRRGTLLTSMCILYVHRKPMTRVPTVPINQPALWNAFGIANIPVPKLAFNKWNIVSKYLPDKPCYRT